MGKVKVKSLSCVRLFATPWTGAYWAPPMGFSGQEYWSGLPFPSPEDLPHPGIKPRFPALQADALPSEPPGKSSFDKEGYIWNFAPFISITLIIFESRYTIPILPISEL